MNVRWSSSAAANEERAAQQPGRAEAIRQLPGVYSLALRLRDAGVAEDLIAECLAVEREALDPLLALAEAKLAAIQSGAGAGQEPARFE